MADHKMSCTANKGGSCDCPEVPSADRDPLVCGHRKLAETCEAFARFAGSLPDPGATVLATAQAPDRDQSEVEAAVERIRQWRRREPVFLDEDIELVAAELERLRAVESSEVERFYSRERWDLEARIATLEQDNARCHQLRRRAFRQGWQACIEAVLEHLEGHLDPTSFEYASELRELYGTLFEPEE